MRYLYQKDKRALPGNLQNRRYSFMPPPPQYSVSDYLLHFFLFSLSLSKNRRWELEADAYLLKLQRLQNKVLRTIGKFPRCIPVRDLHTSFSLPYVYDYIKNCTGSKQKSYKIMRMNMFTA
jgi:hypothetical protein